MSLIVKICGITRVDDALAAVDAGADWIGLNFWPGTPRCVDPETARALVSAIAGRAEAVGVFVNAEVTTIVQTIAAVGLDRVQLHGTEPASWLSQLPIPGFKAFAIDSREDLAEIPPYLPSSDNLFLLDARHPTLPGGTGLRVNVELAREATTLGRMMLAGGLRPENVGEAIAAVQPCGVDTASGVESAPGIKDAAAMRAFVAAARDAA